MLTDGADDVKGEQRAVQIRQPLHLHRDDEEQQHLRVGEQDGEGEEHGQVYIIRTRHGQIVVAGNEAGQNRAQHRQQHAAEVVQIELGRAPLPLQRGADPVVEIQTDQQGEGRGKGRNEYERHQPPHLAPQQCVEIEGQEIHGIGVGAHGQQHQHIHRHVARHDHAHQVGDAEPGMGGAEPLHPVIDLFQGECPPVVIEIMNSIPHERAKVMSFF